jgi:tetratricopeptide (TPR) repeat protein
LGLAGKFQQAEASFAAGDWTEAIIAYEILRNTHSEYEKQTVTEHLYTSYLKQGTALIDTSKGTEGSVREAQSLYQNTLTLRPQDAEALRLIALSDTYLNALSALARGDDRAAQTALEQVLDEEPDYAGGNAKAMLQELVGPPPEPTPAPIPTQVPPVVPVPTPSLPPLTPGLDYSQEFAEWIQRGDAALSARDYGHAELTYIQAAQAAVHGGKDSAKWLFIAYAKAGTASARGGQLAAGVDRVQTAIRILGRSAVAIPPELYSQHVAEGDAAAKNLDFTASLAAYNQAIRAMSRKCHCGLEDWSILP